jgi:hypothetical protein
MANYCGNYASITGDIESVKRIFSIIELAGDDEGIFGLLINVQCCANEDRWSFNLNNFGCRSDIDKSEFLENATFVDNEDGTAELSTTFTTPWSPPLPFYASLSAIYDVRVEVEGEEGGNDFFFVGVAIDVSWGEVNDLSNPDGVYRYQPDYFWDGYLESDIEWMVDEEWTEEQLSEKYPYVTEKDLEEIIKLFNSYKTELNEN